MAGIFSMNERNPVNGIGENWIHSTSLGKAIDGQDGPFRGFCTLRIVSKFNCVDQFRDDDFEMAFETVVFGHFASLHRHVVGGLEKGGF